MRKKKTLQEEESRVCPGALLMTTGGGTEPLEMLPLRNAEAALLSEGIRIVENVAGSLHHLELHLGGKDEENGKMPLVCIPG